MQALWQRSGWTVEYARRGIASVAAAVGVEHPDAEDAYDRLEDEDDEFFDDEFDDPFEDPPPTEEEAIAGIAAVLFDSERPDMAGLIRRITEEMGGVANPSALINPKSGVPSATESDVIFALAVAEMRKAR